jgi:hypothetical protein
VVPPRIPEEPPAIATPASAELISLIPPDEVVPWPPAPEASEPAPWEKPSSALEIQPVEESLFEELGVRIERPAPASEAADDLRSRIESARQASENVLGPSPVELEASLSYDAMRARLEETRDRLKAKAEDERGSAAGTASIRDPYSGTGLGGDPADTAAEVSARIDRLLSETNE